MSSDSIDVTLHDSQALIQIINANTTYCAWQRAGGKTGGGIGPRLLHLSEVMPRSQVLLFSDTYDRLKKRIVPNIKNFLVSKLGLVEGYDFVMYKKPPQDWVKPLIELDDFEHVISFASGMALCLVSLHVEGSANAYNAQAAIGDEIKYCDEDKIDSEVLPALRGSAAEFGHLPEYLSIWMFTDKYGPKIKWFLAKKKLVNQQAVEVVYALQMAIFKMQEDLSIETSPTRQTNLKKNIIAYKTKADRIRKNLVYFSDMKPYENLATLGEFFFKRARRICKTEYHFQVSFLNKDPDKVENCFYADVTDPNYYDCTNDVDTNKSLIISMDYNYRIVPIEVGQVNKLPGALYETLNTVASLHPLAPDGIEEAIEKFDKAFTWHERKHVYYVYDSTAIARDPGRDSYSVMVAKELRKKGWKVTPVYIGQSAEHGIRYEKCKKFFRKRGHMAVMINRSTTTYLQKSINQAGAIIKGSETRKDKRSELDPNFPAEESTHHSEAWDHLLWAVLELKLIKKSNTTTIAMKTG